MASEREAELNRRIEGYHKRGWYPVKYAHHPKVIRDAIRAIGFRPQMKACHANCQRFMMGIHRDLRSSALPADPALARIEYHEGFSLGLIVFTHAWLVLDGEVIDLTLDDIAGRRYLISQAHDMEAIAINCARKGAWTWIDEAWFEANYERAWKLASEGGE